MLYIAGGDEAGRGSMIGPLVTSLVVINKSNSKKLSRIGVRDSKLLTKRKREYLYDQIIDLAKEVKIDPINAEEINMAMQNGISLNELEAYHFARMVDELDTNISEVYLDSPDRIDYKFGIRVSKNSKKGMVLDVNKVKVKSKSLIKVISEHKADVKYPVVSASSIISKVNRDRMMDNISQEFGIDFRSGYPSDYKSVNNIRLNINKDELIKYVRLEWKTIKAIRQTKLRNFK